MLPIDLRMMELVKTFRSLRRTPDELFDPWDPECFADFWAAGSGGEKDAALFVLSVWNPSTDWAHWGLTRGGERGGYFNLHTALANWDREHAEAFMLWCEAPWWP